MIRRALTFVACAMVSTAALAAPVIGQPAPDFKAVDAISGKPVGLADFKGKTVVLEWTNPGCPFVKKYYSVGAMQALQANAAKDGVVWVSINSSAEGKEGFLKDATAVKADIAAHNGKQTAYIADHDGSIGKAYEAKTTPHMFVINKEGTLVYMGAIDSVPTADSADIATATNYVSAALKSLAEGTPVKTASTKAYGCFVKYK